DDLDQPLCVHVRLRADVQRPGAALVVRGEGNELQDPLHVEVVEAGVEEPLLRAGGDEALRARAGVDAVGLDADDAARALLGHCGDADQADELLRRQAGDGSTPRARVAGGDPHLGPAGALSLDDMAADVLGELLDERRLLEDDRLDRLLEELREARHMHALLAGIEIDSAVDRRRHQLLSALVADPDGLLHPADAGAGQRQPYLGLGRLEVEVARVSLADLAHYTRDRSPAPMALQNDDPRFPELVSLACHDLRTPLATVAGFATTLLRMGDIDEQRLRYLTLIEAAAAQLGEIIDDLGVVARLEGGRFEPASEPRNSLDR